MEQQVDTKKQSERQGQQNPIRKQPEQQEYIEKQLELSRKINLNNTVEPAKIHTVAGVDLAYWKDGSAEYAVCCIVVLDYRTHKSIESVSFMDKIKVPYIPGCLAFREIPLFGKALEKLENTPEVFFFDGNGYLHPRHMGLATHAGILFDVASVGIAKSYYKIGDTDFIMPEQEDGAFTDIRVGGEIYGRALRTHAKVKPVFISAGNKVDLDTAVLMAMELTEKESHIPLPTRLADLMTHEERRKYMDARNVL
ncbi:MAG: endonuclease V [Lachnospiraceae bacterium]|nr:endonuclease V [Lachnospiraceae bacterium]